MKQVQVSWTLFNIVNGYDKYIIIATFVLLKNDVWKTN